MKQVFVNFKSTLSAFLGRQTEIEQIGKLKVIKHFLTSLEKKKKTLNHNIFTLIIHKLILSILLMLLYGMKIRFIYYKNMLFL